MKAFVTCVICVVFCIGGVLSACPVGSTDYNGYCLIASKEDAKYQHAQMYCLGYGCKLAVPHASMKSALKGFGNTNSLSDVVFGIIDTLSSRTYVEAPLGTEFTDLDWDTDKPSTNTNNNCVKISTLNDWKMSDVSCTGKYDFICDCGNSTQAS